MAIRKEKTAKDIGLNMSHKVYDLTLTDIAHRKGLDEARLVGLRHIYPYRDRYCVVKLSRTENRGYSFEGVDKSSQVNKFVALTKKLLKHELVVKYHYHLKYLCITDCNLTAIWLQGKDHHHEIIVPLNSAHSEFKVGDSYDVKDFMDRLKHIAREKSKTMPMVN